MQEAGRILLMPKGEYSASATYEMLDLVNHGGASWVCKKDCTGQEPSDSNTEFWQRFGTAVDLSNYLSKSGGYLDGSIGIKTDAEAEVRYELENSKKHISLVISPDGTFGLYEVGKGWFWYSDPSGNRYIDGTASGNLPISGGKVGFLYVQGEAKNGYSHLLKNASATVDNGTDLIDVNADNKKAILNVSANSNKAHFVGTDNVVNELLHTGNKPTGTYVGNGDATARTINIGGVGGVVAITSNQSTGNTLALVSRDCAVISGANGIRGTAEVFLNASNQLLLYTSDATLNANGVTYTYWML